MNIQGLKISICAAIGTLCGVIASAFGGWSTDIVTLLIFMAVDFAMGLTIAAWFKKSDKSINGALSSAAGFKGLCKKCATLLCVLVAYRLDIALGLGYIRTATIVAFIVNEAISILENAGIMGVPIPPVILKAIDILKNKESE